MITCPFPILADERIALEPLRLDHADEAFALIARDRPYLAQWLSWAESITTLDDVRLIIERNLRACDEGTDEQYVVVADGALVGMIGLHHISRVHRKAAIGYWLASNAQGRGIATAACRALVKHAFDELKLHRLSIECAVDNLPSRAIPERLGFKHEATLRDDLYSDGRFHDVAVYARVSAD